jgi:hypothetical protein
LKAGVLENGVPTTLTAGTPQGGVLADAEGNLYGTTFHGGAPAPMDEEGAAALRSTSIAI